MKHLKALCSILVLGFIIFLCSCGKELPNVQGDFSVTVFKNAIEVSATYVDTEEHDLYYDNVRSYVVVENENEDGEVSEVNRTAVSVTKPTVVLDPKGDSINETYTYDDKEQALYKDAKGEKYFIVQKEDGQYIHYLTTSTDGTVSVKTGEKITSIPTNLSASKVTISSLKEGTTYTVKLIITASSTEKVLKTDVVTTLDCGESENDPIIITTLQELVGMNKDTTAYYKLGADINVDGTLSTIFSSSTIFKGHFDGDNHTISGFTISGNNYAGLFGNMFGASVKDLTLKDVVFDTSRGETFLGALAGYAKNCTIENVKVENVKFTYSGRSSSTAIIGGLVGEAENSTIKNCSVDMLDINITSAQFKVKVGGFVGLNDMSSIENCNVNGSITSTITYNSNKDGRLYVGGFAGVNDSNKGIVNSIAKVNIEVKEPTSVTTTGVESHKIAVGGFVGGNETFHNRLSNCAAIGDITVSATYSYNVYVGGLVGSVTAAGVANMENCVFKTGEKGVTVTFKEYKQPENETEEVKVEQVGYVSLTVGDIKGTSSNLTNVIAYNDLLTIVNEHEKVTKAEYVVSTNLTAFNANIQNSLK